MEIESNAPVGNPDFDRKIEFARRVGISNRTCDNWIRHKRIPIVKVGRVVLIPWREAIAHLNQRYRIRAVGETGGAN